MKDLELVRDYRWVSESAMDLLEDKDNELRMLRTKYVELLEKYNTSQINWARFDVGLQLLKRSIIKSAVDSDCLSVRDDTFTEFLITFFGDSWVKNRIKELSSK